MRVCNNFRHPVTQPALHTAQLRLIVRLDSFIAYSVADGPGPVARVLSIGRSFIRHAPSFLFHPVLLPAAGIVSGFVFSLVAFSCPGAKVDWKLRVRVVCLPMPSETARLSAEPAPMPMLPIPGVLGVLILASFLLSSFDYRFLPSCFVRLLRPRSFHSFAAVGA